MRWKNGLAIPVEPKKSWKRWMCDPSSPCQMPVNISRWCEHPCDECIYDFLHAHRRKDFYRTCFPSKPKTLPNRDSKGRFCKKEADKDPTPSLKDDEKLCPHMRGFCPAPGFPCDWCKQKAIHQKLQAKDLLRQARELLDKVCNNWPWWK